MSDGNEWGCDEEKDEEEEERSPVSPTGKSSFVHRPFVSLVPLLFCRTIVLCAFISGERKRISLSPCSITEGRQLVSCPELLLISSGGEAAKNALTSPVALGLRGVDS